MGDPRWTTSNQAYGAFHRAVPLQPRVVSRPPPAGRAAPEGDRDQLARRRRLAGILERHGVRERQVDADGNCQFRALADQLYGSQEHHATMREQVVEQLRACQSRYAGFVPGSFQRYLEDMARDGTWGDHVTLQAAADSLGVKIHVLCDTMADAFIEVTPSAPKSNRVLRITFWSEVHYNSVEE